MFYLCEASPAPRPSVGAEQIRDVIHPRHVRFVADGVEKGIVMFGGPKTAGGGGILLVKAPTLADCQAFLDTDPMVKAGASIFRITEFQIFEHAPCLDPMLSEA